jgi:hypothetical protein
MLLKIFDKTALAVALGAARAVEPNPSPQQDALLTAVAGLHGVDLFPRLLPKPGALRIERLLRDPQRRRRVLELATTIAASDGEVRPVVAANLALLARSLDQQDRDVRALCDLASHHYLRSRIDFTRRMAARVFSGAWPSEQERGMLEMLGRILHVRVDAKTAARYHALANLSETSFGYALWAHFKRNAFRFPGEGGGVPERLLFHDIGHVLSGYGTDAEGELEQAAFQTGCVRDDGFMPLYFGILQFQFGTRAVPGAKEQSVCVNFEKVAAALARGASCRLDLALDWDFWPLLPLELGEVRRKLGVPPLLRVAESACGLMTG